MWIVYAWVSKYLMLTLACSAFAAHPPSIVSTVQPSSHMHNSTLPSTKCGSMVNTMPGSITPGSSLPVGSQGAMQFSEVMSGTGYANVWSLAGYGIAFQFHGQLQEVQVSLTTWAVIVLTQVRTHFELPFVCHLPIELSGLLTEHNTYSIACPIALKGLPGPAAAMPASNASLAAARSLWAWGSTSPTA